MTEQSIVYIKSQIELVPFAHNFIDEYPETARGMLSHYYKAKSKEIGIAMGVLEYDTRTLIRVIFDSFCEERNVRPESFWELCKDGVYYPGLINAYRTNLLESIGGDNQNLRAAGVIFDDFVSTTEVGIIYSIAKPEQVLTITEFMGGIPVDLFETRNS